MNTLNRAKNRAARALGAFHSAVKELEEANRQLDVVKESSLKQIEVLKNRHDDAHQAHAENNRVISNIKNLLGI